MALGDPYISLPDFKDRMTIFDNVDDDRITDAIASASNDVNEYCGRQFNDSGSATARVFRSMRCVAIVDDFSALDTLVVKTGTTTGGFTNTLTINVDFLVGPDNGTVNEVPGSAYWRLETLLNARFPYLYRTGPNLQVTARWGWSSVPSSVVDATYIRAAAIMRRRDTPEGVLGGFDGGNPVRVSMFNDPDLVRLLRPYRKHLPGRF